MASQTNSVSCDLWKIYCESHIPLNIRNEHLFIGFSDLTLRPISSIVRHVLGTDLEKRCERCFEIFQKANLTPLPFPCKTFRLTVSLEPEYHHKTPDQIYRLFAGRVRPELPPGYHYYTPHTAEIRLHVHQCKPCRTIVDCVSTTADVLVADIE